MVALGDPVGTGLVDNLSNPSANITGMSLMSPELAVKRLELLKELVPGISRVLVLSYLAEPRTGPSAPDPMPTNCEAPCRAPATSCTPWFGALATEPPYWYYPVRQSLGAALLQAGRVSEAEAQFQAALKRAPANGWSYFGLAEVNRAKGDAAGAQRVEAELSKTWIGDRGQLKLDSL